MRGTKNPCFSLKEIRRVFVHSNRYRCGRCHTGILKIYVFLEREEAGEKHQYVVTSWVPPTGELPHNPDMCLTGNWTSDPLVHRPALNPLSHTRKCYWEEFLWPLNACETWKPLRLYSNILSVLLKKPEKRTPNIRMINEQVNTK